MKRGYNSPKHHAAGQWQDRNRTLELDSWALLCLLITLSTTVLSISIDFKLRHTHTSYQGEKRITKKVPMFSSIGDQHDSISKHFLQAALAQSIPGWEEQNRPPHGTIKCSKPFEQLFKKHRVQS